MNKRCQVTIFIVLGMILMLFVALFLTVVVMDRQERVKEEHQIAYIAIKQCLENVILQGMQTLSAHGGYYTVPENQVTYALEDNPLVLILPYYYKDGEDLTPSKDETEEQFSQYILANTEICHQDILGVSFVQSADPELEVTIGEESISVEYDTGLSVESETTITRLNEIELTIPSNYYSAYNTAVQLAKEQNSKGNTLCITCLASYAKEKRINNIFTKEFAFEPYYGIIYMINYTEQSLESDVMFIFAGRYYLTTEEKEGFSLNSIEDQTIQIGYQYEYQVDATGENVSYGDDTDLFDIDATTGLISFYPEESDLGLHLIEISAIDVSDATTSTLFYLNITHLGTPILIEYMSPQQIQIGKEFTYDIDIITEDTVYFFDDTELFDINVNTGEIVFTPSEEDEGAHTITITVTTEKGMSATEKMIMVIY